LGAAYDSVDMVFMLTWFSLRRGFEWIGQFYRYVKSVAALTYCVRVLASFHNWHCLAFVIFMSTLLWRFF